MKRLSVVYLGICLLSIVGTSAAQSDNTVKPLRQILNSKSYILVNPAESWIYPGGLLFATKSQSTFIDPPSSAPKFTATPASADFPAVSQTKKFSLSVVLTGLATLIGGNPSGGFGHSSSLKLQEIKASGTRITFENAKDILKDDKVKSQVKQWLGTKGNQVFVVSTVLNTQNLSVVTDSSTNLDLAFNGSAVTKCTDSSNTPTNNSSPPKNSTTPNNPGGPNETGLEASGTPLDDELPQNASNPSTPGSSSNSVQPGGEAHFCYTKSGSVTMNSDNPIVFAVTAYRVQLLNDDVALQPAFSIPAGGQTENSQAAERMGDPNASPRSVKVAGGVNPHWTKKTWEESTH